jgi:hypothetical protein
MSARTTVRIDDDLMRQLKERALCKNMSVARLLNDALRAGLRVMAKPKRQNRFIQETHDMGPPLIDLTHTNALLDEWDTEESIRKMSLGK